MIISHASTLLTTEARIIAEDDGNIVVAVRLDKQTVARNVPFLLALADHATRPDPHMRTPCPRTADRAFGRTMQTGCATGGLAVIATPKALLLNWAVTLLSFLY
jgi:hypothetical protein